jgi:uncharacterized protein (DUF362 family)
MSGAIKNWMGAIPLALRMQHHDVHTLAEYVDIMSVTRPALHVSDAIIIGEGDGPLANAPRWCGCVLASTDPAALDVTLCRLFSLDPDEHRFAAEAAERGLGINDRHRSRWSDPGSRRRASRCAGRAVAGTTIPST